MQEYDYKGKVFTQRVRKEAVRVTIQTVAGRLHGFVYLRPGNRIKDELEAAEQFLAVTDAQVLGPDGAVLMSADFLTLNRDHIVWLIVEEEPQSSESG